jgi:hypothetical protein
MVLYHGRGIICQVGTVTKDGVCGIREMIMSLIIRLVEEGDIPDFREK